MLSYLGDPDVDFVKMAGAFGVTGEQVAHPTRSNRPCSALLARLGKPSRTSSMRWWPDGKGRGADLVS